MWINPSITEHVESAETINAFEYYFLGVLCVLGGENS